MSERFHPLHRQSGKLSSLSYAIQTSQSVLNESLTSVNKLVSTSGDDGHTRHPSLHITRTHEGFEISGEEEYSYIANQRLMNALERTLDEFILPLLRVKPNYTLQRLIEKVGASADRFFPMGVPWTGIYLVARWRMQEIERQGSLYTQEYSRLIELLTRWYEMERRHRHD